MVMSSPPVSADFFFWLQAGTAAKACASTLSCQLLLPNPWRENHGSKRTQQPAAVTIYRDEMADYRAD